MTPTRLPVTGAASALAAAVVLSPLPVMRIIDEERLLAAELPGYDDYRGRVRYRLLPFVCDSLGKRVTPK